MVIEIGPDRAYLRRREAEQERKPIKQVTEKPELTDPEKHWLASGSGVVSKTDIFS